MALLDLLLLVLAMIMARAAWRLIDGVLEGLAGRAGRSAGGQVPARGVQMVRDPVCGTYVIPERAIALSDGSGRVFFCSVACKETYRARRSARAAGPGSTGSDAEASTSSRTA
jgi:YHS domain-containing protein